MRGSVVPSSILYANAVLFATPLTWLPLGLTTGICGFLFETEGAACY